MRSVAVLCSVPERPNTGIRTMGRCTELWFVAVVEIGGPGWQSVCYINVIGSERSIRGWVLLDCSGKESQTFCFCLNFCAPC